MPTLGRREETLQCARRLVSTSGLGDRFKLVVMVDENDRTMFSLLREAQISCGIARTHEGYWQLMRSGSGVFPSLPLIVNLANDLLPGRDWAARALRVYAQFKSGVASGAVIGFNDGIHYTEQQAGHLMCGRQLLRDLYGSELWPTMYEHNFGDSEIVARARQLGAYCPAPYAVLYHNHPASGRAGDQVYQLGSRSYQRDSRLFEQRRASQWKS